VENQTGADLGETGQVLGNRLINNEGGKRLLRAKIPSINIKRSQQKKMPREMVRNGVVSEWEKGCPEELELVGKTSKLFKKEREGTKKIVVPWAKPGRQQMVGLNQKKKKTNETQGTVSFAGDGASSEKRGGGNSG